MDYFRSAVATARPPQTGNSRATADTAATAIRGGAGRAPVPRPATPGDGVVGGGGTAAVVEPGTRRGRRASTGRRGAHYPPSSQLRGPALPATRFDDRLY